MMRKINEDDRLAQHLNDVELDCLKPFDSLLIQTDHSLYLFTVKDSSLRGTLSGGILGRQSVCAVLIAIPKGERDSRFNTSKLSTGNQVVFVIKSGLKLMSVTTSVVTKFFRIPRQTSLAES